MRPMRGHARLGPLSAPVVVLAAVTAACTPNVAEKMGRADAAPPAAEARTVGIVKPQPAAPDISYASSLYVERDVNVSARTSGVIEDVLVDRGARVSAGDPLAVLETDIAERELEIAEQEARRAQAEFDRIAPLHEKKVVSDSEFVEAEISRDQAVSLRELARAHLERCTVRAPYDGVVVERWAIEGQRIQEDDGVPLFRVVAREPFRARVDVPEERLDTLGVGSPAFVEDLDVDESHPARVVYVSPAIDAASGTVPVIVQMEVRKEHLRVGSAVRIRFEMDSPAASSIFKIPRSALSDVTAHENETTTVMIVNEGRAASRRVRIVETRGTSVLVEGQLTPQDQVILGGDEGVREGDSVNPSEAAL